MKKHHITGTGEKIRLIDMSFGHLKRTLYMYQSMAKTGVTKKIHHLDGSVEITKVYGGDALVCLDYWTYKAEYNRRMKLYDKFKVLEYEEAIAY